MSTAERIVAQLKQEQERYDRDELGAKPAIDLVRHYGHVSVPIPNGDETVHREVLALCGTASNGDSQECGGTPEPSDGTTTTTDRYAGRRVDVAALLAEPPSPTPWRCWEFVADGTLTVLGGQSGDGKSWLALALAVGVARGQTVAGIPCWKGPALYVDAEMGAKMFVERLRDAGIGPEIELVDAMGLDLSRHDDLAWLRKQIEAADAKLVVIDSLRRLVPSKSENESDDMAPTVAAVAKLARDTNVAILLVHHMGDKSEKFFRGSSAIKDQADALFALLRDENNADVRRLSCRGGKGKMRYAPEPADRYMTISVEDGGVAAEEEPQAEAPRSPVREDIKARILERLPAKSKGELAKAIGRRRDDSTFKAAWEELEDAGQIAKKGSEWIVVVVPQGLGNDHHHHNGAGEQLHTENLVPMGNTNGSEAVGPAPEEWITKHAGMDS